MTASEKTALWRVLNLAGGYAGTGFASDENVRFDDDADGDDSGVTINDDIAVYDGGANSGTNRTAPTGPLPGAESPLPLAYSVDEDDVPEKPLVLILGAEPLPEEQKLLEKILASAGLSLDRNCVFVDERTANRPSSLEEQLRWFMPRLILRLGKTAQADDGMFPGVPPRVPVLSTCHPRELLRNDALKRSAFTDMKLLMLTLAGLDRAYAAENRGLLRKYADADKAFADRAGEFLG